MTSDAAKGGVFIVIGILIALVALLTRNFVGHKGRQVPRWTGTLLLGICGATFVVVGLLRLLHHS
jgi:hypothetical protein